MSNESDMSRYFHPLKCVPIKVEDQDFKHVTIYHNICNHNTQYYNVKSKSGELLKTCDSEKEAITFAEKHEKQIAQRKAFMQADPLHEQRERIESMIAEINEKYLCNQCKTEENENI